jgi:chemotaxis protein CheZ
MAGAAVKQFRIEHILQPSVTGLNTDELADYRHQEILDAISALNGNSQPNGKMSEELLEKYREDLAHAEHLKAELAEMYKAISDTKREVATLHQNSFSNDGEKSIGNELDAVVAHAEQATDAILSSAETIDSNATDLIAILIKDGNKNLASDIQEQVVTIFEACNFQDLTGQRITKVVNTMKFIEDRINGIMDIWGGDEGFKDVIPHQVEKPQGEAALLNGPSMEDDPMSASQDDIDALFD